MLSVCIPAYNEEKMIEKASEVVDKILSDAEIPHEIIFIDDGSKDDTWNMIQKASESYKSVRGISFSRNFGKEAAIFAGLSEMKGDCCVVMDCDLQHPPVKIIEMYNLWKQGYEVIEGIKSDRGQESAKHGFAAHIFYSIMSKETHSDMQNTSDFKLLDKKAVEAILQLPERRTFFRALSGWVGFRTIRIYYEVQEREAGSSKWSRKALIKYAASNITSFTTIPMQAVTLMGVLIFLFSIVTAIEALIEYIMGKSAPGFTTVIIMLGFIGSIIMMSLGVIGYYIARIYEEIKHRPRYIVARKTKD
ncbi:MAG: glycosyltransferase family 2 protein [Butyrivibrio sp.]|nr:glycosyltransferase family 2 protein [Butyrivibrio sp.]